jgi:hypothetical protein
VSALSIYLAPFRITTRDVLPPTFIFSSSSFGDPFDYNYFKYLEVSFSDARDHL